MAFEVRSVIIISYKYTNADEDKKIVELYRSGQYSYQQVGDMYNLSKGTVINIVKGYPYTQNKDQLHYKLRVAAKENLTKAIQDEDRAAKAALSRGNRVMHGAHLERYLSLLQLIQCKDELYDTVKAERNNHEKSAWECFSNGNYSQFGYHAETWDRLTEILADNARSPWAMLPGKDIAKSRSKSVRFSSNAQTTNPIESSVTSPLLPIGKITDASWYYIQGCISHKYKTRSNARNIIEGVLIALSNRTSFYKINNAPRRTLDFAYRKCYHYGVFADMLELVTVCPELAAVEDSLAEIEKYRAVYGNGSPPTLKMIQEARKGL